jgi:hypothetical protein
VSNTQRVFESVVSIDAWRTTFDPKKGTSSVHVDVSFLKGKLGDEPESPVRVEIALRRAELIFIVPVSEPLRVVQSSVKREAPLNVRLEQTAQTSSNTKLKAAANVNTTSGPCFWQRGKL